MPPSPATTSPPPDDGSAPSLGRQASSGAAWNLAGFASSQLLRLAINYVLAWLLVPKAFGYLTAALAFLQAIELLSDVGISASIVHDERGERQTFLDTAWTLQIVRSVGLWLLTCIVAGPYARYADAPILGVLLPVVGFGTVIAGFGSTNLYTAQRRLAMRSLALIDIAAQAMSGLVMIAWAVVDPSPWALAAGSLTSALTRTVTSYCLPGPRNRWRWDPTYARAMLRFGRWIFVNTLLSYAATQADRMIFVPLVDPELLGVYGMAVSLAAMPALAFGQLSWSVLFPLFSRLHRDAQDLAAAFVRGREAMLAGGGWVTAGLVACGPVFFSGFYEPEWHAAGYMVQLLAVGNWFSLMEVSCAAVFVATARTRFSAAASAAKLPAMFVAIPVGFHLGGFPGALLGYSLSETVRYAVTAWARRRIGLPGGRQDLRFSGLTAATGVAGWQLATWLVAWGWPEPVVFFVVGFTVTAAWLPNGWPHVLQFLARR